MEGEVEDWEEYVSVCICVNVCVFLFGYTSCQSLTAFHSGQGSGQLLITIIIHKHLSGPDTQLRKPAEVWTHKRTTDVQKHTHTHTRTYIHHSVRWFHKSTWAIKPHIHSIMNILLSHTNTHTHSHIVSPESMPNKITVSPSLFLSIFHIIKRE